MALRDESGDVKAQFDMDVLFLTRLDQRFNEAALASAQGELLTWYRILREIYRMIIFKIKEPGHEKIEEELEVAFKNAMNSFNSAKLTQHDVMRKNHVSEAEKVLDEISIKLSHLLHLYGIVMPKRAKFDPTGTVERGICGGF